MINAVAAAVAWAVSSRNRLTALSARGRRGGAGCWKADAIASARRWAATEIFMVPPQKNRWPLLNQCDQPKL